MGIVQAGSEARSVAEAMCRPPGTVQALGLRPAAHVHGPSVQAPGDGPGPRARAGCGKSQDGAETCLGSGRAEDVRVAEERSRWGKNRQLTQEQGVACFPGTGEGESPPMDVGGQEPAR